MPVKPTFIKDPEAELDYGFDFAALGWLSSGETITAVTWTVPAGLTEGTKENDGEIIKVWLSGGTAGSTYEVEVKVTTSDGRVDSRSFDISVKDR